MSKKNNKIYINSPMNYTGGKYKLLNQISPFFPERINTFYDLFAGGASVAINVQAENILVNDKNQMIIELYKVIKKYDLDELLNGINKIISNYGLSDTKNYGYDYYSANSSNGLKEVNQKQYLKLRSDFNSNEFKGDERYLAFYVLIVFSFNNQIRFNKNNEFNMPPGKRDFNKNMIMKFSNFKKTIDQKNIIFESKDFREFFYQDFISDDFVYVDPPYLISTATYNENGLWKYEDEIELYKFLDFLDEKNVRFAMSNVIRHKGRENTILEKWASKYKINFIEFNYNNSNYQKKNVGDTVETLITNY